MQKNDVITVFICENDADALKIIELFFEKKRVTYALKLICSIEQ